MPIVLPNPLHASQAPTGELKENEFGTTSPYAMSQCAQCLCAENLKTRDAPSASGEDVERPSRDRRRTGMCAAEPQGRSSGVSREGCSTASPLACDAAS